MRALLLSTLLCFCMQTNALTYQQWLLTRCDVQERLSHIDTTLTQHGFDQHVLTMQAIMLRESNGGTEVHNSQTVKTSNRSYGIMQVQIATAKAVLARNPIIVAEHQPISELLMDDDINILVAVIIFDEYYHIMHQNWTKAVTGYNIGIGRVLHRDNGHSQYASAIKRNMSLILAQKHVDNDQCIRI